jgi:tRNA-specific 2-thiouridylase
VTKADGGFRLILDRPAYGVAPGQTAVLYDDGAVVGAGTIKPAETHAALCAFQSEGE